MRVTLQSLSVTQLYKGVPLGVAADTAQAPV